MKRKPGRPVTLSESKVMISALVTKKAHENYSNLKAHKQASQFISNALESIKFPNGSEIQFESRIDPNPLKGSESFHVKQLESEGLEFRPKSLDY